MSRTRELRHMDVVRAAALCAAKPVIRFAHESVEEFLARGGTVEVLPAPTVEPTSYPRGNHQTRARSGAE